MSKRQRQYVSILIAIIFYYIIHEGAHYIAAILYGTFKQIKFMGLGVQIDVYAESMSNMEIGIFCIAGAVATLLVAWILVLLRETICKSSSKLGKAIFYYMTIAMMFIDPLYLSILCDLFGGGDMNGISFVIPELFSRIIFMVIMLVHILVFIKIVLPTYKKAFEKVER